MICCKYCIYFLVIYNEFFNSASCRVLKSALPVFFNIPPPPHNMCTTTMCTFNFTHLLTINVSIYVEVEGFIGFLYIYPVGHNRDCAYFATLNWTMRFSNWILILHKWCGVIPIPHSVPCMNIVAVAAPPLLLLSHSVSILNCMHGASTIVWCIPSSYSIFVLSLHCYVVLL